MTTAIDLQRMGHAVDRLTARALDRTPRLLSASPSFRELVRRELAERVLRDPSIVERVEWEPKG